MLSLSTCALVALATFYACHVVSQKEGPFALFSRLRERLGVKTPVNAPPFSASAWGRLVGCPICLAPYFAVLFVALWLIPFGPLVVTVLAIAGASSILELLIQRK